MGAAIESIKTGGTRTKLCYICHFTKKTEVDASYKCEDCNNVAFCADCTMLHRKNKVTENHTLVPLKSEQKRIEGMCEAHGQLIKNYCCTCSIPVCLICVHVAHGDHSVRKFNEVFRETVATVGRKKAAQEKRSQCLNDCETEFKGLKAKALDRKDTLVTAVEDQANKCIEQITEQKQTIKKNIIVEFDAILEVTDCLETIPALATKLDESVTKADRLLSDPDPSPSALTKLCSVSDEIDDTGNVADHFDSDGIRETYKQLWQKLPSFVPNSPQTMNIGTLNTTDHDLTLNTRE
jgi:hypothetical protein